MNLLPMDRARLTVVAPLMTEGGTEAGPPIIWGPRPYRAARGTACWWWTGQGSPSHVCDMGGMEAAEAAAANMGTLWTDLKMKIGELLILFFMKTKAFQMTLMKTWGE